MMYGTGKAGRHLHELCQLVKATCRGDSRRHGNRGNRFRHDRVEGEVFNVDLRAAAEGRLRLQSRLWCKKDEQTLEHEL